MAAAPWRSALVFVEAEAVRDLRQGVAPWSLRFPHGGFVEEVCEPVSIFGTEPVKGEVVTRQVIGQVLCDFTEVKALVGQAGLGAVGKSHQCLSGPFFQEHDKS
ncbi:hypothetical protein [Streptomyces glomeratus]|uniref:Uncharacterized protein n=1 Tax=Streptomyces glomeratus TaxID=284452 RepID=A0ABP6LE64_9ACTN|nr:hypothetical protein [Streptomyces glomeratus]MCF1506638.1 hypothetical protein [Streptomyces glomeratus]